MKRVLLALVPVLLWSEPVSSLYEKIEKSEAYKSRSEAIEADLQMKKSQLYTDGWRAGADVGYADVKEGSGSGTEYGITVGKDFVLGGSNIEKVMLENSQYAQMVKKIEKNRLAARIRELYGSYCITLQAQNAKSDLGIIYDDIIRYIDKGVKFGEFDIGKSIMAHLALENLNLQIAELDSELKSYESKIKAIVPFDGKFECSSMMPDFDKLFDPKYSALSSMLQKKVESAADSMKVAKRRSPMVGVDAGYSDEIDTRRYMLSISLPLSYGSGNEAARAAAMHTYAAARNELEAFRKEYAQESEALKTRLENYKNHVTIMENSIKISADTLIEQSRMRFKAGEESLISMLKSAETKLQMTETILDMKTKRHKAVSEYIYKYAIDPKGVTK